MCSHGYVRKSSPWEEAIRIPCIFVPAGSERVAVESDAPFNHVDFAPTTLALCGIAPPEWMQGTDFSHDIVPGRPAPDEEPDSVGGSWFLSFTDGGAWAGNRLAGEGKGAATVLTWHAT